MANVTFDGRVIHVENLTKPFTSPLYGYTSSRSELEGTPATKPRRPDSRDPTTLRTTSR